MKHRLAFAAILLVAASAAAQEQLTIFASGGKSMNSYHGQADVQSFNLEWSRRQWRQTDVGIALASEFVWQPNSWSGGRDHSAKEKVRAGATSIMIRHYWQTHPVLYAELSSGPMWAQKQVPAATSRFNFLSQGGVGAIIGSNWRTPVMIGIRFAHLSNAGLVHPNPGVNFSALVLGLQLRR
jgi:lipid A 3-O-deacylase PagL